MRYKIITLCSILILPLFLITACKNMNSSHDYGEKVTYTQNENLTFPDFTIHFVGERREESAFYPNGFLYYDFEVSKDSQKQVVSWSAGTGDIGPMPFKFNGKDFLLEKSSSDILGKLKENEIIIWTKERYDKEMEE